MLGREEFGPYSCGAWGAREAIRNVQLEPERAWSLMPFEKLLHCSYFAWMKVRVPSSGAYWLRKEKWPSPGLLGMILFKNQAKNEISVQENAWHGHKQKLLKSVGNQKRTLVLAPDTSLEIFGVGCPPWKISDSELWNFTTDPINWNIWDWGLWISAFGPAFPSDS